MKSKVNHSQSLFISQDVFDEFKEFLSKFEISTIRGDFSIVSKFLWGVQTEKIPISEAEEFLGIGQSDLLPEIPIDEKVVTAEKHNSVIIDSNKKLDGSAKRKNRIIEVL